MEDAIKDDCARTGTLILTGCRIRFAPFQKRGHVPQLLTPALSGNFEADWRFGFEVIL